MFQINLYISLYKIYIILKSNLKNLTMFQPKESGPKLLAGPDVKGSSQQREPETDKRNTFTAGTMGTGTKILLIGTHYFCCIHPLFQLHSRYMLLFSFFSKICENLNW